METAKLVYDDHCPLCKAYTSTFVKYKFINEAGRISFSELKNPAFIQLVDWERAKNEIPLIDESKGKVYYGVDALLQILGAKWSFFKWYAQQSFLMKMTKILYKFISVNRRVIVPASDNIECSFDAKPDFNLFYRIAYLVFAWLITAIVLTSYSDCLSNYIGETSLGREFLICGGQILFQAFILISVKKEKVEIFEYLGNMMTISLGGAILLSPFLLLHKVLPFLNTSIYLVYFFLVVAIMLFEHLRRVKLLSAPKWLTFSWIVYRVLVLILILFIK